MERVTGKQTAAPLAPTIGPTVGGYLTDALSWHWLFFINVVPGIGVAVAAFLLIDFDEPDSRGKSRCRSVAKPDSQPVLQARTRLGKNIVKALTHSSKT